MTKPGEKPNPAFRKGKKNKGGRPIKINDDLIFKICEHLKHGAYVETAVACAGVPKETFYYWMRKANEEKNSIYKRLLHAVEKAQAESEAKDLMYISKHASKNWNAAAWRLERKYPGRWSQTHRPAVPSDAPADDSSFSLAYNFDDDDEKETEK